MTMAMADFAKMSSSSGLPSQRRCAFSSDFAGDSSLSLAASRRPNSLYVRLPSRVSYKQSELARYGVLAMSTKRSPKRLKYSTQRLAKEDDLLYVEVDPYGATNWKLDAVVQQLKQGAVGVIPTDTVYAMVCDVNCNAAIDRLRRLKDIDSLKPLSILCRSFHDIDVYTTGFPGGDNHGHQDIFRAVKHCLPGPYTFILTASKQLPRRCINYGTATVKYATRKTIGVRIPNDAICKAILEQMDAPLISTSLKSPKVDEWIVDPVVVSDVYGAEGLDFVVDGGVRVAEASTVVDMTESIPIVIRRGKGPIQPWMVTEEDEEM